MGSPSLTKDFKKKREYTVLLPWVAVALAVAAALQLGTRYALRVGTYKYSIPCMHLTPGGNRLMPIGPVEDPPNPEQGPRFPQPINPPPLIARR